MGLFFLGIALSIGLGLPIAVFGAGLGQGRVGAAAMDAIARQPEAAGKIQTGMIIALALIESLVIYSLLITFLLLPKVPNIDQVKELAPVVQPSNR